MALNRDVIEAYAQGASLRSCELRFGIDRRVLRAALAAAGIQIKDKAAIEAEAHPGPWRDAATMRDLYEAQGLSTLQIAARFGCDRSVVTDWLGRHDIKARTTAQTQRGKKPGNKGTGKRNSAEQVLCACGCGTPVQRFTFKSIERRYAPGHRPRGEAHPLYKPRSPNKARRHEASDYRQWRKTVLAKDDFTCNCCGQRGGNLHAHHVIGAAQRPDLMLEPWNGKALCKPCHIEVHVAAREVF